MHSTHDTPFPFYPRASPTPSIPSPTPSRPLPLPTNNPPQNTILKSLISETSSGPTSQPSFKYAVNSTIIQHLSPVPGSSEPGPVGRRGMHSAVGAYWNNEKDGMWSFKYEGGDKKGMDIVISVMWVAI